jgi:hypothetical protein
MRLALALLALGLLAFAIACGDSEDSPATTNTPDSLATPAATNTPPPPEVVVPCPVTDEEFCDLAQTLDAALKSSNMETIIAATRRGSQTCYGAERSGPCAGMSARTGVTGYVVGFDASDSVTFETEEGYLTLLRELASTAIQSASDEYGDGSWRLVAIVKEGPDAITFVTTFIGTDPIYQLTDSDRRVFLFHAERTDPSPASVLLQDDGWLISVLLATVFVEQNLTGVSQDGSSVDGWMPWGEG